MTINVLRIFEGLDLPESVCGQASDVLTPMIAAIGEVGYQVFLERRPRPNRGEGGPWLPTGGSPLVNVIPGTPGGTCAPVLVAFSQGRRGPMGFDSIMQEVKTHLIRCGRITRTVFVFCDAWDGASFRKLHRAELKAHHGNGIGFCFLMAGDPDRLLVQVPVDLA